MKSRILIILIALSSLLKAEHFDWPMWRYDHNRSSSTPEQLSDNLYLQWNIRFGPRIPVWDDPLNQNLMPFDNIFEPIVADNKIFLGFNDKDKVVALDINTGKELWHFYVDGPVRLPMAYNKGKLFFTSDDGCCYCLDANTGRQLWNILLAPAGNKLLGNKRLISMWPARGGIVIKDDILYTAASIWPMMGTFIYAIETNTGRVIWKNEGTSDNYILQAHKSPAFADIAPQGYFTISGDKLLVAGGRTVPAAFHMKTGEELYYLLAESGNTGGAFTCCNDRVFFNQHRERKTNMYNTLTGQRMKIRVGDYPVVDGDMIYFSGNEIIATALKEDLSLDTLWKVDISASKDLIKAGNCLYAAGDSIITAVKINGNKPFVSWKVRTEDRIERLLAAQGKLIAVTADGDIMVYGDTAVKDILTIDYGQQVKITGGSQTAIRILKETNIMDGYATIYGAGDIDLLKTLIAQTQLNMVAFDRDEERIGTLREYFDRLGVKTDRLCFMHLLNGQDILPKYFSSLTIVQDPYYLENNNREKINSIYESVRPYGGKIWIKTRFRKQKKLIGIVKGMDLHGLDLEIAKKGIIITRQGALKGSSDWTHNNGNIFNTLKSDDELAKAPLGILWFGGNSNLDVLPRHGHGPGEQVVDGRLIIEGVDCISARDVYTGRVLWKRVSENLKNDTWQIYYDETYDGESPLNPKGNQVHIPGANARGTNFIATKEYVYLIEGIYCRVLDIKTGEVIRSFTTGDKNTSDLGYIGVYNDYLILGNNFSQYPEIKADDDSKINKKFENFNVTASQELVVLNRFDGKRLWSIKAKNGFIHNSVIAGDGILFCLDKLPLNLESKLKRRGEKLPEDSRLLYIEINTGKILFEETKNIFGSWLGYSPVHKLLLQATRPSRDMITDELGKRMIVYNANTREVLWDKEIRYNNPPIIHDDIIYTSGEAFYLLTGEPVVEKDFITGEDVQWKFKREYGCGYIIASEHLLTFRSASAGFVNLETGEGTGNLGGFKAGCSANLIAANGVLNSPDYTRTCHCPYQNQTSLAFISMPWMSYWTTTDYKWSGKKIKQLGLNLNAPGDRISENKTLWIDYPSVGGVSPEIPVRIDTVQFSGIRKHPVSIKSENTPWITASALVGLLKIEINLSNEEVVPETFYTVNLYFSELENKKMGERIFDVGLQKKKVIENFDIVKEAGTVDKEVIKSFRNIKVGRTLTIDLIPVSGNTILSGIEVLEEIEKFSQNGDLHLNNF